MRRSKKKTTLFLHFLCTSVRIGISYESTCFAFLYLPNPHRAFDNMLFSSPLQHSRYASFLRPPPNRTEIEKQNFPSPRSRVRNSPLTLAIAVIGEAPPQTHFFPLSVVGSHSCTSPLYSLLVTPFFSPSNVRFNSRRFPSHFTHSAVVRPCRCYSSWLVGGDPLLHVRLVNRLRRRPRPRRYTRFYGYSDDDDHDWR